jgi:GxxExxY protein
MEQPANIFLSSIFLSFDFFLRSDFVMPIEFSKNFRALDQEKFGAIAYDVMEQAFQVHNKLGRFFDEEAYQLELAHVLGSRAGVEAGIMVKHADFFKTYFIDLLVDQGAIFELKTVNHLTDEHRAQLLNYLLLTESRHGKLINFRPERVEHEFVNTTLTHADRTTFEVDDSVWDNSVERALEIRRLVEEFLRDWGTGLDLQLYVDALTHFLGGEDRVVREIDIVSEGRCISHQKVRFAGTDAAFKFTALSGTFENFESHTLRFLKHTDLKQLLWINVTLRTVTMKTLIKIAV